MNNLHFLPPLFFKERGTEGVSFSGPARVRDARYWGCQVRKNPDPIE